MIISCSRRTDIPAFYSEWFYNRIKEGYCTVPNPFNNKNVSVIDLSPQNVDVIVFWTRNAASFWKKRELLEKRGYKYYFQFTINNYGLPFEPGKFNLETVINNFKEISDGIGSDRIIWRYDPIIFTPELNFEFHSYNFKKLCNKLSGYTKRVVISIVDGYRKTKNRLKKRNIDFIQNQIFHPEAKQLLKFIAKTASKRNIEVQTCAENIDLIDLGIIRGKCIDNDLIKREFGINLKYKKDKGQRNDCLCSMSRDIGMSNTCLNGCKYCYAVVSDKTALKNHRKHNPGFSSLIKHEFDKKTILKIKELKNNPEVNHQINLF